MSAHAEDRRISVPEIRQMKKPGTIVSLTAYTKPMAQFMDPYVDLIIVGDSLGMVAYGMNSTLGVSLDMMIHHGKAVVRGTKKACILIDMPFGTYQESPQQAYRNCARALAETEAQAVKLEGGVELAETVAFLTVRGIPVMSHIGLMPQHLNTMGGFRVQAKDEEAVHGLVETARTLESAGAFSLLIEGTFEQAAAEVTRSVAIPTIGIGASPQCDGQVLVTEDILGLYPTYKPKFAKQYVDLSELIREAFARYEHDVRNCKFPTEDHCFGIKTKHQTNN